MKNDRILLEVNLTTLAEREVYRVSDDWVGYGTGWQTAIAANWWALRLPKATGRHSTTGRFSMISSIKDRTAACCASTCAAVRAVIHEEKIWLGHPIYRPFDDHTVAFCHEGPHDLVDARMWLVNEDGSHVRKVKAHAPGESCTHEFWVPDGSALIYVSLSERPAGADDLSL